MFNFEELLISTLVAILALSFHEFAHGYTAYKLGDRTAYNCGRVSLNPLVHLDILGFICMVLFRFGWAKPVPINARNFKNPKRGFAVSALAGPLTNVILGFLSCFLYLIFYNLYLPYLALSETTFVSQLLFYTTKFFAYFFTVNIGLGVFNMLPIPPFDGSRILYVILPEKLYFKVMQYERVIYWVVVAWLLGGDFIYKGLTSLPFIASNAALCGILQIFSLSELISKAVSGLTDLIINFWLLLPIF